MGEFATTVQTYLCDSLAAAYPRVDWETEYRIDGTPVDVAGVGDTHLYLIELEWRRADPADNAAKLFRHLDSGEIDAEAVTVFHLFTNYYDLARGGVSSKRQNAEFVGRMAAASVDRLSYLTVDLDIDPPKRGGEWPETWQASVDESIATLREAIEGGTTLR
ncbi:MAG: hypothetical protein R6V31_00320 [Halohasta sp.]